MNDSERRPLIGLTTYFQQATWGDWSGEAAIVPGNYVHAVADAGGSPVLLPPVGTAPEILRSLHGLVVIGGSDVDPSRYGQQPHEQTRSSAERDAHDFALVDEGQKVGLPMLCICRGAQVLNVARGGTLHQHLPDLLDHGARYRVAPAVFNNTMIRSEPGTRAEEILGASAEVASYHHQAIAEVGEGLRVTARSDDDLPQILEGTDEQWIVAPQYHPEERRLDDRRLFAAFVNAARDYRTDLENRAHGPERVEVQDPPQLSPES